MLGKGVLCLCGLIFCRSQDSNSLLQQEIAVSQAEFRVALSGLEEMASKLTSGSSRVISDLIKEVSLGAQNDPTDDLTAHTENFTAISGLLVTVLAGFPNATTADQSVVNDAGAQVVNCVTLSQSTIDNANALTDTQRTDHEQCRIEELRLVGEQDDACTSFQGSWFTSYKFNKNCYMDGAIDFDWIITNEIEKTTKTGDSWNYNGTYWQFLQNTKNAYDEWKKVFDEKSEDCQNALQAVMDQNEVCGTNQTTYYQGYCQYIQTLDTVCESRGSCLSLNNESFYLLKGQVVARESTRVSEATSVYRVKCIVDYMIEFTSDNSPIDQNRVTDCIANDFADNVSSYKITFPTLPTEVTCEHADLVPGTSTWRQLLIDIGTTTEDQFYLTEKLIDNGPCA